LDPDLTPVVAIGFFCSLDFGGMLCADALVVLAAAMRAVFTRSVRSLMVGTYPEKPDKRFVKGAVAPRDAPAPMAVPYGVIMFRRIARCKPLEKRSTEDGSGDGIPAPRRAAPLVIVDP
jgi:hypothetical protein